MKNFQKRGNNPMKKNSSSTSGKEVKVLVQHVHISLSKAQRVIDQIRGRSYEETLMILELMPYRACYPIFKLVYSAAANASYNMASNEANLVISKAEVNKGTTIKKFKPRARGRSYPIKKPTCHITIVMKDISLDDKYVEIDSLKKSNKHIAMAYRDMYSSGGIWDKK